MQLCIWIRVGSIKCTESFKGAVSTGGFSSSFAMFDLSPISSKNKYSLVKICIWQNEKEKTVKYWKCYYLLRSSVE